MSEDEFRELLRELRAANEALAELVAIAKAIVRVGDKLTDVRDQLMEISEKTD